MKDKSLALNGLTSTPASLAARGAAHGRDRYAREGVAALKDLADVAGRINVESHAWHFYRAAFVAAGTEALATVLDRAA